MGRALTPNYQWGVYYRKDIFEELGLEVPATWDDLLQVSAALKENDIAPFTIGTKYLWTAAGWFDYLNLRSTATTSTWTLPTERCPIPTSGWSRCSITGTSWSSPAISWRTMPPTPGRRR